KISKRDCKQIMEQKIVFQKCSRNELAYQLNIFSRIYALNFSDETRQAENQNYVKFDSKKQKEVKEKLIQQGYIVQEIPSWINFALEYLENKYQQQNILGKKTFQDNHLLQYQQDAIKLIIQRNGNTILADEQFLGKSLIALKVAQEYRIAWPLLIVTSGFKKQQWLEYVKDYIQNINENDILIIDKSSQQVEKKYQVVIIQYEVCSKFVKYLQQFQIAIADDVHQLKCYSTQKSQALIPILSQMKHKILITNKFQELKPKHVYNLLKIMFPIFFKYTKLFLERFCDPRPSQFMQGKFDYEGVSCGIELDYILSLCVIKRSFQDVYNQLPQLIYKKVYLKEESSKQIQKIQQLFQMKRIQNIIQLLINIKRQNAQIPLPEQKIISDELLELQTLSWQAKGKSILKFFKDLQLKNEKLLIVVKFDSTKQILSKLLKDLSLNFYLIQNMSQLIENIEQENNVQKNKDSPLYYIIDYDIQIPQSLLNVDYIIFVEFDLFFFQFQKAIQIANSKNKKIKCLFLMNSGSLDELIYKILFQETNLENIQQLLRESSVKKQLISIPSTKVKIKKKTSQIQTEKTYQNEKQQTIDKYIFKSEINCHHSIQTSSDQMFYFSNGDIEENSQKQISETNEKSCKSQLKPNTKRNLNEEFDNIEYITPQKIVIKEQLEQQQRNKSQKNSSGLIKMIDIGTNQITSFDTFMKTDQSNFNLLENPVKDENLQILEQKSQNSSLNQQNIQKSKNKTIFPFKSVKLNLQTQFNQVSQIDKLNNPNNDEKIQDEQLQKLIYSKQTNQTINLSQKSKQKDKQIQINQINDKFQDLNKPKQAEEFQQISKIHSPKNIIYIKNDSNSEQDQKKSYGENFKQKLTSISYQNNKQIIQNDLSNKEIMQSKQLKQQEKTQNLLQGKLNQGISIKELLKQKQNFDVKKQINVLLRQCLSKEPVNNFKNDPILENLSNSINKDIAKLLKDSYSEQNKYQQYQNNIQSKEVDLNNQNQGTFELIDQFYNMYQVKDNIELITQQPNQIERKSQENIDDHKKVQQIEKKFEEKKIIIVDHTFDIFLHQI
ncbi:SNF2 family amine-terminal domain protein, partial (macronuclear) [Tetrahymena thermophila SB210]